LEDCPQAVRNRIRASAEPARALRGATPASYHRAKTGK
jgi:hypothetical protein